MRIAARTSSAFRPRIGPSGTSARQATASDPARIALARSWFGGAFDVIPVLPPCEWTSTEIDLRSRSSAPDAVSAVRAAAVDPRGPASPASIASTEVSALPHSHGGGEGLYP